MARRVCRSSRINLGPCARKWGSCITVLYGKLPLAREIRQNSYMIGIKITSKDAADTDDHMQHTWGLILT